MQNYLHLFTNILLYVLRSLILIIYFFFLTRGYFVFVFFVLFGMHCNINDSLLHLLSHFIVSFTLWLTFFFSIMLNVYYFGENLQFFIGKEFLQKYLPGPLKGVLPLALFISTISLLESVDTFSLLYRIEFYQASLKDFKDQINIAKDMDWGKDFLLKLESIEMDIREKIPSNPPSKGILTEYTERILTFFR